MPINRQLRTLIAEGRPTRDLRKAAVENKMLEFRHSALLKVARGVTSTEEVFRVIPSEHLIEGYDADPTAALDHAAATL
jgi:general secretion pathway protein E